MGNGCGKRSFKEHEGRQDKSRDRLAPRVFIAFVRVAGTNRLCDGASEVM
jgi:hypothetical protein